MKRLLTLLAMGLTLSFWCGVFLSLLAPLPGQLNQILPLCGVVVALMHWLQAGMIRSACKPYFTVTRTELVLVLVFGVFAMGEIRARLKAIIAAGGKPQS
ncbi:DUF1145 domain-containing protein [Aeromonas bivalvium]|uniref:DUF1145 domain-containing protein n=1 Tax=Aeromonas bivalvium TaxID=440079 RepID=A0ABW9GTJ0_9GAMM